MPYHVRVQPPRVEVAPRAVGAQHLHRHHQVVVQQRHPVPRVVVPEPGDNLDDDVDVGRGDGPDPGHEACQAAVGLLACFVGSTMPAMKAARPSETGIVSGVVNTAQRLGAGMGVAVLAAVTNPHTSHHHGGTRADAENAGFHTAFLGAAGLAVLGLLVALLVVHTVPEQAPAQPKEAEPVVAAAAEDGQAPTWDGPVTVAEWLISDLRSSNLGEDASVALLNHKGPAGGTA